MHLLSLEIGVGPDGALGSALEAIFLGIRAVVFRRSTHIIPRLLDV